MRILLTAILTFWSYLMVGQIGPCDLVHAGFSAQVNGAVVQFSNTTSGTGDGTLFFWNFGDGTTSQDPQPTHDFGLYGSYEVCLTVVTIVEGPNGQPFTCDDIHCQLVRVGPEPICSPNFMVEMDAQPQGNGLVNFVATSTILNTNFIWYFGDGTQSFGPMANHVYAQDGIYAVCVSGWYFNETTQDTCWIEDCEPVEVNGSPCNGLESCFVTNNLDDGLYFFDNCSSQAGNAQYFWNFGDGGTSTVVNAEHQYELPGVYTVCLTVYEGNCADSTCTTITIAGPCNSLAANFGWSLAGGEAEFFNVTVPVGLSTTWSWDFGDGSTSAENSPSHFYITPGTYQACLTATSILEGGFTCTDTYCVTVVVQNNVPCLGFEACFEAFPVDGVMLFENCSTPTNGQYFWDFGDGESATGTNTQHTYAPGTYTACLSAYWGVCADTTCTTFTVVGDDPCQSLQADFGAFSQGQTVSFLNSSFGAGIQSSYIWSFGDGDHSTEFSPEHTYAQPGSYEACLIITSLFATGSGTISCQDTYCTVIMVGNSGPCGPNFAVELAWNAGQNNTVVLNGTSNRPETYFIWYLGDGTQAYGPSVTHTYAEGGNYTVCLAGYTIDPMSSDTCWIEDCEMVVVGEAPCSGLEACFVTNDSGNGMYFFDNCSSQQNNAQFLWNFGDGTTSTITNVEHLFVANGTYEVCLKGLYNGCSFETCQAVVVTDAEGNPCDALNAQFTPVVGGFGVNIQNAVVDQNWVYQWSFGDGTTGYGPNTGHQYTASGVYDICLVVYTWDPVSQDTCFADHCETVTIDALDCDPNFAVELAWIEGTSTTVNFIATSNHPNTNFIWYFGDGTEEEGSQVVHTYPENGTYYPCVTGWYFNELTQDTCYIEDCTTIVVGGPNTCDDVVACFEPVSLPNNIIYFENCSSAPVGTDYFWDFGDGSTSQNPIIEHVYQPGTYTACLVLSWENCVDSTCTTVTVGGGGPCEGLVACFEPEPFENGAYFFVNCSQTLPIGIPVSYFWDFGDGTTSVNAQPDHLFDPGTYTICLTITQGDCVDTTCVTITVGGGLPCEQHQADFTTTPNGLAIQFTSTSTGTSANTEYLWSFGDGSIAGGPNPLHDYAELGVYEVCLQITTVVEAFPGMPVILCQDSVCYTVDVGFNDFCDQLEACFLPLPFENGAYLFENCSQVLPIDIPAYAFWDFGDGATSTEWFPTHSFAPGIYSVCLTVVHGQCADTTCSTITVSGGPGCDPNYTASFTYTVQNNAVIFQANIDTPTLGVVWTFPGGDQAYEPVHTHLFEPPGPFEVCLSTWYWSEQTQDSCWAHTCQLIDPFNTSTSVDENSGDAVRLYPVPAHDMVTIEGIDPGAAVQLFSADGRLISSTRATSDLHQVDVSVLAPGTYLLTLEQDGARIHRRLVVE